MLPVVSFFLLLLIFPLTASAAVVNYYYSTASAALSACKSDNNNACIQTSGNSPSCIAAPSDSNNSTVYLRQDPANYQKYYWYYGCVSGSPSSCTGGKVTDINSGSCVCPAGQSEVNGVCKLPEPTYSQDCPKDQYRISSGCVPIPDCNKNSSTGGFFFDVTLAPPACARTDINICMSDINTIDCPALDHDCIKPGQICSNNQANIDYANSSQPVRNASAKTQSQSASSDAAARSSDAAASASAKQAAAQAAQQEAAAAAAAAQASAQAYPPPSPETQAAQQASAAAAAKAAASAAAAAAAAESAAAAQQLAQHAAADDSIITPSYPGGRSENAAGHASGDSLGSLQRLNDTLAGIYTGPNGDGEGGSGTGSDGSADMGSCPGCAKESTLAKLGEGVRKTKAAPGSGSFDNSEPSQALIDAQADLDAKFAEVKSGLSNSVKLNASGSGQLPVFDFGTIMGVHVIVDLNKYADPLSWVGLLVLFMAALIAVRIFLE